MGKRLDTFLSRIEVTVFGAICLALSFFGAYPEGMPDPAWAALLLCGYPILYEAWVYIRDNRGMRRISSALLVSSAMAASVAIGDLFAAGEVACIMALGETLEGKTRARAEKGLKKLVALAPDTARRICDGKEETVPVSFVSEGDILRVLPGEKIPVDGVIVAGMTSVDQSVLTGEALPVDKETGDDVFCGTMNRFGAVDIRASRVGEDSSLSKLIRLVEEAGERKAPMQRLADKWAGYLVPAAMAVALLTWLLTGNVVRGVTVLVVFCPCALVLATPTAIVAAIGQAAQRGVIIKSGEALERMGAVDTVAFDKTGTITSGKLTVSDCVTLSDVPEETWLARAAAAESRSGHPLARAVSDFAEGKGLKTADVETFSMTPGRGISAVSEGHQILCGNRKYLEEEGVVISPEAETEIARVSAEGKAVILTADGKHVLGLLALSDTIRPETADAAAALRADSVETVLLTGDHRAAAEYIAGKVGFTKVCADLLPEEKEEKLREFSETGRTVCMVGDGVNDAPALKSASVGIAMAGSSADIAVEAADIALVHDDLSRVVYLRKLAKETMRTIRTGITVSMLINFVAVGCSVTGILTPTTGALVHNAGSCAVILFAALLYDRKIS